MSPTNSKWNTQYSNGRDYRWLSTDRLTYILNRVTVSNDAKVLDIGCGTGQLCRDLVHRGFCVKGIDSSDAAIEQAKQSTMLPESTIKFAVCDVEKDTIDTRQYDLLFCKYVLAFIVDKDRFLQRISSLTAQNGVFVVISPDKASLPPTKQGIAVNHEDTTHMLMRYFDSVSAELVDGDYYYLCKFTDDTTDTKYYSNTLI